MGTRLAWLFRAVTAVVLFLVLIPNLKPFSVASVSPPTLPHSWSYFLSDNEILILLESRGKKHWYKNKSKKLLHWHLPRPSLSCKHYHVFVDFCPLPSANLRPNKSNSGLASFPGIAEHPMLAKVCHWSFYSLLHLTNVTALPPPRHTAGLNQKSFCVFLRPGTLHGYGARKISVTP